MEIINSGFPPPCFQLVTFQNLGYCVAELKIETTIEITYSVTAELESPFMNLSLESILLHGDRETENGY